MVAIVRKAIGLRPEITLSKLEQGKMLLNIINKRNILFLTLLLIIKILLPSISFADADKVFKENNKAVVVIIAYDQKGKPISQGSRLYNLKEGIGEMSRLFHCNNEAV